MIKFITYSVLFALLIVWLSQNNGFIQIDWLGYQVTIELLFLIPTIILAKLFFLKVILLLFGARRTQIDSKKLSAVSKVISGLSYLKTGDIISANNCISRAKKFLSNEEIVYFLEANKYLLQGNLKKAKVCLSEIVNNGDILRNTALNQMLEIAYKEGDLLEAENIINKIINLFPNESWSLLRRGEFYCKIKKYEEALIDLQKVSKHKLELNYDINHRIMVICYAIAKKYYNKQEYNKALNYLNQIKYNKKGIGVYLLEAKIYYNFNKHKKALNILGDIYQQKPHQDLLKCYIEYGGDINKLPAIVENDVQSSWQCTSCYKKLQEWDYICNKCDSLGTVQWL